ncbi:MAG: type II secretion system protein GspC [Kangiellaceae bacterium]|nr:type II secretion system protein GspC [Kangiellaceae bacterium]
MDSSSHNLANKLGGLNWQKFIKWAVIYANWLPLIQWIAGILITIMLAKMFWVITLHFVSPDVSNQKSTTTSLNTSVSTSHSAVNINSLVARELFGSSDAPEIAAPVQMEVERETRLNLTLRGIYAADIADRSNSIIEDGKGKQAVYFIDDKLDVSGRVYLRQVYPNRVILETNGVNEVLFLKDSTSKSITLGSKKSNKKTVGNKKSNKIDMRKNKQVSRSLQKYRSQMLKDPLSLIGLVKYQPKMENGQMIGIQISPGKDKRLFTQLGLRRRDVITEINGVTLDSPDSAMKLLGEIQDMQELQVEIRRNNQNVSLLLNLSDQEGI